MKFFVLFSIIALAYGQNYCDKKLCPMGGTHIGCNNDGNWAKRCSQDVSLIDLGPYVKDIVASHNEKRNQIAGGELRPFKSAARMATMQWDTELAYLAELNVRKCQGLRHDDCHGTKDFKYSGQNTGLVKYFGYEETIQDLIDDRIDAWWNEWKDASPAHLAKYPKRYSGKVIGHFTVMAAESNVRVGCAASHHYEDTWEHFLFVCNYATTNIYDYPIYAAGKTASACQTGIDQTYKNLCSKYEKYSAPF